ncbi:MAG: LysR family transcriptional regulator [Alphaproteobacteria bacterium]|nr:LysR family transcriptional regulator [Alphaproteobacteria bacterium]
MYPRMNWNDLRYVLTVARHGTLSAAARRLGVDQTTVARRLAAAEARLGARLFDRVDGALRPTQAGEAALAHAERVEAEIGRLQGAVGGADAAATGTVRLSSVPILVNRVLMPRLPALVGRHPGLMLELAGEARNVSLSRREADLALRQARPSGGTALTRRVGRLAYAVYAPARVRRDDLPWITYEDALADLPQARWIATEARGEALAPLRVNDADAALAAVRAGLGRTLLPVAAAKGEPGLRRIGTGRPVLERELWLMVHPELRRLARIEAVITWIEAIAKAL